MLFFTRGLQALVGIVSPLVLLGPLIEADLPLAIHGPLLAVTQEALVTLRTRAIELERRA